jgi:hypothetical protein
MIVFDLACSQGHVFEAWFGTSDNYEDQRRRRLVSCPICGAADVDKAPMAPNVAAKGNSGSRSVPMRGGPPAPPEVKTMLAALAKVQAKLLEGSEHVGPRFAAEARAIHDGDAPDRQIHGQATREEAKALIEDGVPVAPLPLPVVPPEVSH